MNDQIKDKEVRLIDSDGAQLGIVSGREAQRLADEKRLDLVKIAPLAKPPVCKIMDYSKYKFETEKKMKEARKKQKSVEVKELRLSPQIEPHDVGIKFKKAVEFLKDGDKVKITVLFRSRSRMSKDAIDARFASASVVLNKFAEDIREFGSVEKPPKLEGRTMSMFLAPHGQK